MNLDEYVVQGPPYTVWAFLKPFLQHHGETLAQIDAETGSRVSFNEMLIRSDGVCELLQRLDLPKGSVVLYKCRNSPLLATLLLGTWKAHLACALIHPGCKDVELQNMQNITRSMVLVEDCPIRVFIGSTESASFTSVLKGLDQTGTIVIPDNLMPPSCNKAAKNSHYSENLALVLCSSGSSGLPKGVALSHQNLYTALFNSSLYAKKGKTALSILPQSHAFGLVLMLMCLKEGASLITMDKFNLETYLDAAECYQVKTLYMVPQLLRLISINLESASRQLRWVEHIWTGAGNVASELQRSVSDALPQKPKMLHSYGLTETTFTVFSGSKPRSCGTPTLGFACKVVDPVTQVALPHQGSTGELLVKSQTVMMEYLGDAEATSAAFDPEGWLRTGDLGYFDQDGYFYFVERIKEMIKCNSHQVSPTEVEQAILRVAGVQEALVFGRPDNIRGEVPVALVVKAAESTLTPEDLKMKLSDTLSSYKLPKDIHMLDKIPKSPNGKPLRKEAFNLFYPARKPVSERGMQSPMFQGVTRIPSIDEEESSILSSTAL